MTTEQEAKNTFKVEEDDRGLIRITFLNTLRDPEDHVLVAEAVEKEVLEIYARDPGLRHDSLVNTLLLEDQPTISSRARKVYARLAAHEQTGKIAVTGKGLLYKIVVAFIARVSGREFGWFADIRQAEKWLGEK